MNSEIGVGELQRLGVLVGTWDTTITLAGGATSRAVDTYRWTSNGSFLLHEVAAEIDGKPTQSIEVFGIDESGDGYSSRSYESDGSINEFKAHLRGGEFSIVGALQRFSGQFSEDRRVIEGEWEQCADNTWSPLMTVKLVKRS